MSKADHFHQYVVEATRWAFQSKTENEKILRAQEAAPGSRAALALRAHRAYVLSQSTAGRDRDRAKQSLV
jgi:hypothetical protein